MKSLLCAVMIAALPGASLAGEPSCRQDGDVGKSLCVAGVLYRCACRPIAGGAVCSWDNAASACSAITSKEGDAPAHVISRAGPAEP
ncbi:hypothetical protein [Methylosinus sp. Sm6]|uniref:hypothetical protein n=1 Tax=Methylosinus sp. Sm6 TaxID=2866948 RepID=UPI001C99D6D9|nr:hypothetical protein [Methylosinus sp. Sm6]MBY6242027.1 hypothetical protein [Methylosinus sp. Sm6]